MAAFGGCGVFPSGAYHQELPTTVPDRRVDAPRALPMEPERAALDDRASAALLDGDTGCARPPGAAAAAPPDRRGDAVGSARRA